jgi:hypothetical protein
MRPAAGGVSSAIPSSVAGLKVRFCDGDRMLSEQVLPAAALLAAAAGQLDHAVRPRRNGLVQPILTLASNSRVGSAVRASPFGQDRHQWVWAHQPEGSIPLRRS